MDSYRRCPNCGNVTKNSDYCSECGTLINTIKRRKLEQVERENQAKKTRDQKNETQKPNAITVFFAKARNHPNPFIKFLAKSLYSVWIIVFTIGGILAYIIAFVAA